MNSLTYFFLIFFICLIFLSLFIGENIFILSHNSNDILLESFEDFYTVEEAEEDFEEDFSSFSELNSDEFNSIEENGIEENGIEVVEEVFTTFEDVAGNEEAKEELKEIVNFLKAPDSFFKLGAGIPKGVLLSGPPGTGKTLLARAIAGESETPFLKVSGSQFVELLVGLGASRVRDLFEKARQLNPCIIFIDEIDSIARARSSNINFGGANDEREQTLNQLLTEMDGFQTDTGIVVIGATNRPDILDSAILRPGRFDRQITILNPTLKEREAILKVHLRNKRADNSISIPEVAQRTIGFSGADLANLLNESAILAARKGKKQITLEEINTSIDRIILGLEGSPLVRVKSRQLVAFQEISSALFSILLQNQEKIEKITLLPRGGTNGSTWKLPFPSLYSSRILFFKQILISLSGRATEEMIGGVTEFSSGLQEDIVEATRTLRAMILRYAMIKIKELKQESQERNSYLLGSDIKIELTNFFDDFATNFVQISYDEVLAILKNSRPLAEQIADELITFEELNGIEIRSLINQYFENFEKSDLSYTSREVYLFEIVFLELRKSFEEISKLRKKIENILN